MKVFKTIREFLSRRGAMEIDSRSQTFIITDVRWRIDKIAGFIKSIDKPEFSREDVLRGIEIDSSLVK